MNEDTETTLTAVSRDEAMHLLSRAPVGRVAYTIRALPAVSPVNFIVDGNGVVIRVGEGSKLAAAVRNNVIAFEADEVDTATHTGWSVTLVGRAHLIRDPGELARLEVEGPRPWAPGVRDRFIRITAEMVTGRRLRCAADHGQVTPDADLGRIDGHADGQDFADATERHSV